MDFSARTALTPVRRLIVLLKEVDVLLDAHRFVGRQIAIAEDVAIRLVVGLVGAPVEGPGPDVGFIELRQPAIGRRFSSSV